jgi:phenylacetaldehyde dehydrogenase
MPTGWRALGNETEYGLNATIWTRDIGMAHRLARRLRSGTCASTARAGSTRRCRSAATRRAAGARENGKAGIEAYTELKAVSVALD